MRILSNKGKKSLCFLLAVSMLFGVVGFPKETGAEEAKEVLPVIEPITEITEYETNELLVRYKEGDTELLGLPDSAREEKLAEGCIRIEVDTRKELRQTIASLEKDENVSYIQPNYTYYFLGTQDTYSSYQWQYYGEYNIAMEEAWAKGVGVNEEIIVAIMDVGIDYNHEDLQGAMWVNSGETAGDGIDNDGNGYADDVYGYNFFDGKGEVCEYAYSRADGEYVDDHATHIAGIIAGRADNGMGIAGIASRNNVKLMSLKVMGDARDGNGIVGYSADIMRAIEYAEANGAKICNMSLGYTTYDLLLYACMQKSELLFVCAAGNGMQRTGGNGWNIDVSPLYPAAFDLDHIISVANMNTSGMIDASSCYGAVSVDIAAPGTDILSSVVDDPYYDVEKYMLMTGTSMAAPMVTAVAALTASYHGNLTTEEIKEAVLEGASLNIAFADKIAGSRMLNAAGAISYYEKPFEIHTELTEVSAKSNNKRVHIRVNGNTSPVSKIVYVQDEKRKKYFEDGTVGISLAYDGTEAVFKATKSGVYTIYVLCEDGTESTETVWVEVPTIQALTLSAKKKTLKKGKTYTLKTSAEPDEMYVKVTYKSSNTKVATVNAKGKITAKKKGTAKITVTASDGNTEKKAVCTVTVKK